MTCYEVEETTVLDNDINERGQWSEKTIMTMGAMAMELMYALDLFLCTVYNYGDNGIMLRFQ
jgi:hypothetical protein